LTINIPTPNISGFVTAARHYLFAAIPILIAVNATTHWIGPETMTGILAVLAGLGLYSAPPVKPDPVQPTEPK